MTELEKLSLSQPLIDVYNAMEQDIMLAIAKQLAKDGSISASSEWRLQRLAEAGDLNKTVIEIIASYTGIQSDLLTEALSGAANSVIDKLEPGFRELAKQGFISDTPVPASKSVDRAIQTFHKQAASDLNLVNTVMRYKAKQAYVDLVNKTYDAVNAIEDVSNRQELLNTLGKHTMSTVMGAESRTEAVRKCIREFNNKGIPAFVDAAGREWSPEAYINMDIRTTVSNTANAAQDARCDDYGIDLIAVSSHPGARPKCAPYQGRVFSRSNQSGITHDGNGKEIPYEPLSSTSYGEPDGLFGINCKHKKYPFIDGVNFQRYFPYDKEENDKRYKEIQEQRRLERQVRKTKTEVDMLNEVGDTEGAKASRAKLKEQRKAYRTYCDEHDLTQRNDRLTVSKTSSSRSNAGTGTGNVPKASYAKAAEVNVLAPESSGKAYTGEKIVKAFDNSSKKMATSHSNDWSNTVPQKHSKAELDEISTYAKERGIKLYQPQKFDGDIEMLRRQIDTISGIKSEYNINQKITLEFANMIDDDFAEIINNTIRFNNKAMRNAAITNFNLNSDNQLAATDFTGIAVHEMGHIISRTYGEKGLDIAKQAYYNIFKENISQTDLLDYLYSNVSEYSIFVPYEKQSRNAKLKEITPEILSKSKSANSNDFSEEFIRLLKEAMINEKI